MKALLLILATACTAVLLFKVGIEFYVINHVRSRVEFLNLTQNEVRANLVYGRGHRTMSRTVLPNQQLSLGSTPSLDGVYVEVWNARNHERLARIDIKESMRTRSCFLVRYSQ